MNENFFYDAMIWIMTSIVMIALIKLLLEYS